MSGIILALYFLTNMSLCVWANKHIMRIIQDEYPPENQHLQYMKVMFVGVFLALPVTIAKFIQIYIIGED